MKYLYFILLSSYLGYVNSAACPTPAGMASFDSTRFLGTWSVLQRSEVMSATARCDKRVFTPGSDMNVAFNYNDPDTPVSVTGTITNDGPTGDGNYQMLLGGDDFDYVILDTDYSTYAAVFYCFQDAFGGNEYYEIITKSDPLGDNSAAIASADMAFTDAGLSPTLIDMNHTNCTPTLTSKWESLKAKFGNSSGLFGDMLAKFNKGGIARQDSGIVNFIESGVRGVDAMNQLLAKLNKGGTGGTGGTDMLSQLLAKLNKGGTGGTGGTDMLSQLLAKLNKGGTGGTGGTDMFSQLLAKLKGSTGGTGGTGGTDIFSNLMSKFNKSSTTG